MLLASSCLSYRSHLVFIFLLSLFFLCHHRRPVFVCMYIKYSSQGQSYQVLEWRKWGRGINDMLGGLQILLRIILSSEGHWGVWILLHLLAKLQGIEKTVNNQTLQSDHTSSKLWAEQPY